MSSNLAGCANDFNRLVDFTETNQAVGQHPGSTRYVLCVQYPHITDVRLAGAKIAGEAQDVASFGMDLFDDANEGRTYQNADGLPSQASRMVPRK